MTQLPPYGPPRPDPRPPPPEPPPPPHHHHRPIWISVAVVAAVAVAVGLLTGVIKFEDTPSGGGGTVTTHHITYQVQGSAQTADVTFQNENGDTSQQSPVRVPWSYTLTAENGDFLYISAQNQGETGTITCTILVDGIAAESNTSTGAFTICTASGSL